MPTSEMAERPVSEPPPPTKNHELPATPNAYENSTNYLKRLPVHHELGGNQHVRPRQHDAAAALVLSSCEDNNIKVNLGVEGGGRGSKVTGVVLREDRHFKLGREGKTCRCILNNI